MSSASTSALTSVQERQRASLSSSSHGRFGMGYFILGFQLVCDKTISPSSSYVCHCARCNPVETQLGIQDTHNQLQHGRLNLYLAGGRCFRVCISSVVFKMKQGDRDHCNHERELCPIAVTPRRLRARNQSRRVPTSSISRYPPSQNTLLSSCRRDTPAVARRMMTDESIVRASVRLPVVNHILALPCAPTSPKKTTAVFALSPARTREIHGLCPCFMSKHHPGSPNSHCTTLRAKCGAVHTRPWQCSCRRGYTHDTGTGGYSGSAWPFNVLGARPVGSCSVEASRPRRTTLTSTITGSRSPVLASLRNIVTSPGRRVSIPTPLLLSKARWNIDGTNASGVAKTVR
eukprot:m.107619 g.107619  ORF g.107619 m.107619 type:complete len:346 (-) comp16929_c0_seq11:959-1996(-)